VASPDCEEKGGVSAPAASEPGSALDRGMWIALRCDWRRLRRRPGHLRRRDADARNDPIPVTFRGDPTSTGICCSPPFSFGDRLITRHVLRILRPALIAFATGLAARLSKVDLCGTCRLLARWGPQLPVG
jgi:hypothetical protein